LDGYPAFVLLAGLLTITPGADMALVARNALIGGRAAGIRTAIGVCGGLLVWGAVCALGVAAVLASSATAFSVVRWAGAAYLVFLGAQTLWRSRDREGEPRARPEVEGGGRSKSRSRSPLGQGLITNLLNPKIAVFYTTFVAQLAASTGAVVGWSLLLAGTHALLSIVWLAAYASLLDRFGRVLRRPAVRRWLERLTGGVLVAFGLRVATERG
jgi:threonine/homoserine/homoserine lactone efflux protein